MNKIGQMKNSEKSKLIPKVELHLHLEGAVRRELVSQGGEYPWMDINYRFESLTQFIEIFGPCVKDYFAVPEAFGERALEMLEDLASQNVRYVEFSFSPIWPVKTGMDIDKLTGSMKEASDIARERFGIQSGIIAGISREYGCEEAMKVLEALLPYAKERLVGIDLHGDETAAVAAGFKNVWQKAADAGLKLRAHAGETGGPESVWSALNDLNASRIGHGIRSVEDESLIAHLINSKVCLEVCPISNWKLGLVDSIESHPIRKMYDLGLNVTYNTDDPLFFGSNSSIEAERLLDVGFSVEELAAMTMNAASAVFAGDDLSNSLSDSLLKEFGELGVEPDKGCWSS